MDLNGERVEVKPEVCIHDSIIVENKLVLKFIHLYTQLETVISTSYKTTTNQIRVNVHMSQPSYVA